jgi:pimeloyl-ACP methyl ester carboxylesterase
MTVTELPDPAVTAPPWWMMALESRAFFEYGAMWASIPWLARLPCGDGHTVIVFPGLIAGDLSTLPLRLFLESRGYQAHAWEQGINVGPGRGVIGNLKKRVRELQGKRNRKVSLIGWSLGGVYARELAKMMPELVRQVITLGTPFAGDPKATNAWRLFELVSKRRTQNKRVIAALKETPPVPTTSILSYTDGVVAWPLSVEKQSASSETIAVQASHVGMGFNPLVLYAIADRLSQPEGNWKPFVPDGVTALMFDRP